MELQAAGSGRQQRAQQQQQQQPAHGKAGMPAHGQAGMPTHSQHVSNQESSISIKISSRTCIIGCALKLEDGADIIGSGGVHPLAPHLQGKWRLVVFGGVWWRQQAVWQGTCHAGDGT